MDEFDLKLEVGDFQERCHCWAAVQAAFINGSCPVKVAECRAALSGRVPNY
ncbi:hypothetical protein SynBMKMC1_02430 [Synechococcus sp. BMK-MC-1]|nr:hypothetical protein SynBMKMC1_02430 [Synechococcus sp. BMK-MC-1]